MNIRPQLNRLEQRHREQNRCPLCAQGVGATLATVITVGAQIDYDALACKRCGAKPVDLLVVVLEPEGTLGCAEVAA